MEEVASTPKLVDPTAFAAEGALTATLPRSDIEAAAQDDAGADLLLEIARIQNGERDDRKIKVSWQKDELEDLLRRASGDPITLTFSREELERMLDDPDFEAHGLREKVLVLTVAAVTAAGAAGSAVAMPVSDGGTSGTSSAAVSGIVTDASSSGITGAVTSIGSDTATSGTPAAADPTGVNVVTDVSSGGQPGAVTGIATDASTSGQPGAVTGIVTDTGSKPTQTPAEPASGGFSMPDAAVDAALAAGLALLITGAAFVTRSRRRVQPA
jgi:hypothetical protein